MTDQRNILVIIDFESDPVVVVERASWLAKLMDCELDLMLCDPDASPIGRRFLVSHEAEDMLGKIEQAQQDVLDELANVAAKAGVKAATRVLTARPIADGILEYAADSHPELVVKGTHFHAISERSIIIGTDWQLIRSCPHPLYFVKQASLRENPVVIAAVDPTHEDDKPAVLDQAIIDRAKSIADGADGQLHLFHSYVRLLAIGIAANKAFKPGKLPIDEIDSRIQKEHRDALDELATRNEIDEEHTHQLPGRTHELLPAFARSKGAQLVVMGALARWGLKRMVIGSTAERVLDHLPCDVLIVRAEATQR